MSKNSTFSEIVPSLHRNLSNKTKISTSGKEDLCAAIRKGNLLEIRQCIDNIPDHQTIQTLNEVNDSDGLAPLHAACRYGNAAAADLLLQHGARVDVADDEGKYPMHYAAKFVRTSRARKGEKTNQSVLLLLIENGADVNVRDCYLATPLHYAAKRGHAEAVRTLLESTDIETWARDDHQSTPLHEAARQGHLDIVYLLLSVKRDFNFICLQDENRCTPFHVACRNGHIKVAEAILNASCYERADGSLVIMRGCDAIGNTSLHAAVEGGHCGTVQFLLTKWDETSSAFDKAHGSSFNKEESYVNVKRCDGYTALHLAADCGSEEMLDIILSKQPALDPICKNKHTPLFLTVEKNHLQSARALLLKGCDAEQSSSNHLTPFLIACKQNNIGIVKLLLDHGVDVAAVDKDFQNCLILSAEKGNDEMLQILLAVPTCKELLLDGDRYGNTAMHIAAANGHPSILKILVDAGMPLNIRNDFDETPLHLAAANSRSGVISFIVDNEQSRLNDQDESYRCPIHVAAYVGDEDTLAEFIRLGAKTDVEDGRSWTALHTCASRGWFNCAKRLLEDNPSLAQKKTRKKETALHLACGVGSERMVELLLEYDSDVTARLQDGRNALEIAIDNNHENCAIEFLKYDNWMDSLKTVSISNDTGAVVTPLRRMIKSMPNVASLVLTKCISSNDTKTDSKEFEVTFNYELLEDMYEQVLWKGGEEIMNERLDGVQTPKANRSEKSALYQTHLAWENEAYVKKDAGFDTNSDMIKQNTERGLKKQHQSKNEVRYGKHAKPYSNSSSVLYHNHPLKLMVSTNSETLLCHPTVVSLLNYKWNKYGRALFLLNCLCYWIYMGFLNYYMLTNPPRFTINETKSREDIDKGEHCARVINEAKDVWGERCVSRSTLQYITIILIISFSALQLMKEVGQMVHQRWSYFTDVTNYIELVLYSLSILVFVDVDPLAKDTGLRTKWQWECGAFVMLLSWMNLLLYIRRTPLGIYVFMITSVARSFLLFGIIVLFFLLGFSFSFYVLLQNQYTFYTPETSCVKTFAMMIGELDYASIFLSRFTSSDYQDAVYYEGSSYAIFVMFLVIMCLLVSNLLVGIAVDDIAAVQEQATLKRLAIQVDGVLDIEYAFPAFIRRRMVALKQTVQPNRKFKVLDFLTWILSQEKLNFKDVISQEKQQPKRKNIPTAQTLMNSWEKSEEKISTQNSPRSNTFTHYCSTAF